MSLGLGKVEAIWQQKMATTGLQFRKFRGAPGSTSGLQCVKQDALICMASINQESLGELGDAKTMNVYQQNLDPKSS